MILDETKTLCISNSENTSVTWSSSNEDIVAVSDITETENETGDETSSETNNKTCLLTPKAVGVAKVIAKIY